MGKTPTMLTDSYNIWLDTSKMFVAKSRRIIHNLYSKKPQEENRDVSSVSVR